MRGDRERLLDLLDAIEQIQRYLGQGREAFDRDELVRVWAVYHLQIIGEAARSLTVELRASHSEVPWAQIIGMRHILVHQYFGLQWSEVWDTIQRDLPALKRDDQMIIVELGGSEE